MFLADGVKLREDRLVPVFDEGLAQTETGKHGKKITSFRGEGAMSEDYLLNVGLGTTRMNYKRVFRRVSGYNYFPLKECLALRTIRPTVGSKPRMDVLIIFAGC